MTQQAKKNDPTLIYAIVRKSDNHYFCGSHGWSPNINNALPFFNDDDAFDAIDDMGLSNKHYCLQLHMQGECTPERPLE